MIEKTAITAPEINPKDFDISDLTDEIRVDSMCQKLLKHFHRHVLCSGNNLSEREAGALAHGADYFVRDFVIDGLRINIFTLTAKHVRGFAGNWYIHRTLEPNTIELESILRGTAEFYRFCADCGWVSAPVSEEICAACSDLDYYRLRINSFHDLTGDDYVDWCQECPLP